MNKNDLALINLQWLICHKTQFYQLIVSIFNVKCININNKILASDPLAKQEECSSMSSETGVQSQVESYQRLKKCYLIPPCLTLCIIR